MKKMLFYMINAFICSLFLSVKFAYEFFVFDKGIHTEAYNGLIDGFAFMLICLLILNIYLGYLESKK